jgi:hypothetical protein
MNPSVFEREFGVVVLLSGAPMLLLALAIPYAILKMRDARLESNDPEIGLKSALYYGFSLGILLSLVGLTFMVYEALEKGSSSSSSTSSSTSTWSSLSWGTRTGLGLLASGIPTAVTHLVLILGMTNDRRYPDTRRIFVGWRLAIHSLVVLTAYTAMMLILFLKDRSVDLSDIQLPLALLIVWLPSWLIHLILLRVYQRAVMPLMRVVSPTIRSRDED